MRFLLYFAGTLTCYSLCAETTYEYSYEYTDPNINHETQDEHERLADSSEEDSDEIEDGDNANNDTYAEETQDSDPSEEEPASSFAFGDDPLKKDKAGYNLPAQISLEDKSWQGFVTASYIYWNAQQDGMDLATSASYTDSAVQKSGVTGKTYIQDFPYRSGYKLGIGYDFIHCDHWSLRADFTSLHQTTTSSQSAPSSTSGTGVLYLTNWFYRPSDINQNPACTHLHSSWHLGLDWFDVSTSRPFYQGKRFTVSPFGGIRASWISQSLKIGIKDVVNFPLPSSTTITSHNKLSSWGIGPRIGMNGHFLLGAGWRLQGSLGASLLFTEYDHISHSEGRIS